MSFTDNAYIYVKAGDGGDGCSSFHREKYVNRGGPDGGDGGNGGSIIFVADKDINTLINFKFVQHYRAENGEKGRARLQSGKNGEDILIKVPVGTVVTDIESDTIIADMNTPNKIKTVLRGGRGGKGNARFATPTKQAPKFAQPGQKTIERKLRLTLKTIADVGLVGLPNVGKSTLLSVLTAAKPKIASYQFTTLTPNLGVASYHEKSFVLADIPGLIEGAAKGVGLGHDFLRHIERTGMLLHIVDMSGFASTGDITDDPDLFSPLEDFEKISAELSSYSEELSKKPYLIVANKMDVPEAATNFERFKAQLTEKKLNAKVFPISAASGIGTQGFDELLTEIIAMLDTLPKAYEFFETDLDIDNSYEKGFDISRDDDGAYVVSGGTVDYILNTTYPDDEESMRRFQQLLIKEGIIAKLREYGATEGSSVRMGEWEFDFIE